MAMPILVLAVLALAQAPPACNDPPKAALVTADVPGNPFQALPSADGRWVFVSVSRGTLGCPSGIALYRRGGGELTLERVLPIAGNPAGMTLTHDGKTLIASDGDRVAFVDTEKLINARADALIGY